MMFIMDHFILWLHVAFMLVQNSIQTPHSGSYFPVWFPSAGGLGSWTVGPLDLQMRSHNQDVCPGYPERRDLFAGSRLPGAPHEAR